MGDGTQLFHHGDLAGFLTRVFEHCGLPPDHAVQVTDSMIVANLRGVDTHGVIRTGGYVERFRTALVNPRPAMTLSTVFPCAVAIDADNAMGAVAAGRAMDEVLERAATLGIGGATVRRSNHFGAASVHALRAARAGCVGIVLSPASKSLAPFGSMAPMFGTNPIAVAIPAGSHAPWVLDMATSIAARGHVRVAARRGEPIPQGWALDAEGRPTTDAEAALGGVMLPFAGPKGSALAMMVDILGGVMAGSGFGGAIRDMTRDFTAPQDVGHFFLAFRVEAFMPAGEFAVRMDEEIRRLKALRPAAGFDEVCYPGEREARLAAERMAHGIPVPPETLKVLQAVAGQTGIALPEPLGQV